MRKKTSWFIHYETTNLATTQGAIISKFNDIHNERQAIVALREMKQWKHEIVEDYYNNFLQLCAIIPQQPNDVYLRKTFKEGLRKKLKLTIIGMLRAMIILVVNFVKEIE